MLTFKATDTTGKQVLLPAPLTVRIRMDEDVPADDLYAVFPESWVGELCSVTVLDGARVLFKGIVDEQECVIGADGCYLRLSMRSPAAFLLDNEAMPRCYDHPSARMIYERYAEPYGIAAGDMDDATCFGELTVTKGMSRWGVIQAFCTACYSSTPRVSVDGVLYLKGMPIGGTAVFGGKRGIRYTSLTDSRRRCDELSCVNVKLSPDDGYAYRIENTEALERGICRERYLNAMLNGQALKTADIMLLNSRKKARTVTVNCPGRHIGLLGYNAVADDGTGTLLQGLYVCAITYRMDQSGENTQITLRRRSGSCGYPDM